jgi:peptidoglycan hydrolase-like protein with peptidoglycan-binding domain
MSYRSIRKGAGRAARRAAVSFSALILALTGFGAATVLRAAASPATFSRNVVPTQQSKKKSKKHKARHEPGQKAPTADRIQEIQSALAREGYYQGEPSGKWDDNTQDAMRRFQEEHALTGNGKIDAPSLQKLGLGSDIAGVSAPRPPQQRPSETSKPSGSPAPAPGSATPGSSSSPSATVRQ